MNCEFLINGVKCNENGNNIHYNTNLCDEHFKHLKRVVLCNKTKCVIIIKKGHLFCTEHIRRCSTFTKKQCTRPSTKIFESEYYCTFHFNKKTNNTGNNTNKKSDDINDKFKNMNINKDKKSNNIGQDAIEIIKEINNLKKQYPSKYFTPQKKLYIQNNKSTIKKQIYKILLKIHPDKCNIIGFDANKYTIIVNDIKEIINSV